MADSVASQTISQDGSFALMKFTNISDGTGESAVVKVDVSALSPACAQVRIRRIWYIMYGMAVRILWDATTDVVALLLPADGCGVLDFRDVRGISNDAGAGITGDILFTTVGHTAGDTYSVILELEKIGKG